MGTTLTGTKKGNNIHGDINFNNNTLFVSSSGNIGIGTTSPAYKLAVDGNIQLPSGGFIYGQSTGNYLKLDNATYVELGYSSTTAIRADGSDVTIRGVGGTANMTIESGGNVGIGTSSPASKLHIIHTDASLDTLRVGRSDNSSYWRVNHAGNDFRLFNGDASGADILFGVDSGGFIKNNRVGIQVANPTAQLHISSSGTPFKMERGGYDTYGFVQSTGNGLQVQNFTDARTEMFFKGDGTVGIGTTSPNAGLEVANAENSTLRLTRNSNTANYLQLQGGSSGAIYNINTSGTQDHIFQTGGNEKMRLTSTGNVGIGTTSPSAKFHLYDGNTTAGGTYASPFYVHLTRSSTGGSPSATYFTKEDYSLGGTDQFANTLGKQIYAAISNNGNSIFRNIASRIHTVSSGNANRLAHYITHFEGLGTGTIANWYGSIIGSTAGISGFSNPNATITNTYGLFLGSITSGTQTNAPYAIYQGGTEKIFLQGNVGIGMTSPNAKLAIGNNSYNGNLAVASSGNNNRVALLDNLEIVSNNTGGTYSGQSIAIAGSNRTFGFVAGGALNAADSSAFKFTATLNTSRTVDYTSFNLQGGYNTNTLAADYTFMKIDGNIYQGGLNQSGSITGIDYNPNITQLTGSHTAMRLRSGDVFVEDGNVGIGTTNPAVKLTVNGGNIRRTYDANNYSQMGAGISGGFINGYSSNSEKFIIRAYASNGVQAFFTAGNVGIGTTSPSYKLTVTDGTIGSEFTTVSNHLARRVDLTPANASGLGAFTYYNTNTDATPDFMGKYGYTFYGGTSSAAKQFQVFVGDAVNPRMVVRADARVGIGTTAPTEKLHVVGNVLVTGKVTAEEFHTEFVSASIIYQSGSTKFGDDTGDEHSFTGSILLSGSYLQNGAHNNSGKADFAVYTGEYAALSLQSNQVQIGSTDMNYVARFDSDASNATIRAWEKDIRLMTQGGSTTQNIQFHTTDSGTTSEKMRITGAGNVGIGTTSPDFKLDVAGDIGMGPNGKLYHNGDHNTYIGFTGDTQTFRTGGTDRMSITNTGVGIGTTSPDVELEVEGTIKASTHGDGLVLGSPTTVKFKLGVYGANDLLFKDPNNNVLMALTAAGNFGIGTTSPSSPLTVAGRVDFQNDLRLRGTDSAANQGVTRFYVDSSNKFHIDTANDGNNMFVIDSAGTVGIGTTSPSSKLHVSGAADVLLIEGSGSTANTSIFAIDGNNGRLFEVSDDLSDSLFSVNTVAGLPVVEVFADNRVTMGAFNQNDFVISGSKIGIGTSAPSRKLDVQGDINIGISGATTVHTYYNSTTRNQNVYPNNSSFEFHEGVNERVRIAAGGNVGIGTTNPTLGRLHVKQGSDSVINGITVEETSGGNTMRLWMDGSTRKINAGGSTTMMAFDTTKLYFPTGNVGIGTTTPRAKLEIQDSTHGTLMLSRPSETGYAMISGSSGLGFEFKTYDAGEVTAMKIANDGNVGIGTTSPDSPLEIYSDSTTDFLKLTSGGSSASPIKLIFEKSAAEQGIIEYNRNGDLEIYNSDADGGVMINGRNSEAGDLYVADGGNVGIGTTTPQLKLHISGSTGADSGIRQSRAGVKIWDQQIDSSGRLIWSYYASEGGSANQLFTLDDSNRVGIGTTSPSEKLEVLTSTDNDVAIKIQGKDGANVSSGIYSGIGANGNQGGFVLKSARGTSSDLANLPAFASYLTTVSATNLLLGSNSKRRMMVQYTGDIWTYLDDDTTVGMLWDASAGNLGIGTTSPSGRTHIVGNSASEPGLIVNQQGAAAIFEAQDNGSSAFIIRDGGKVGINITSPSHTLDIVQVADSQGLKISGFDDQSGRSYSQFVDQNGHISLVASSGANLNYTVQNGHFNVNLNTSTKDFRVKDSGGTTVLNVTGDSKVGIGTQSPAETLHLSGSMRIDGAGTGTVQEQGGAPDTAYTNSTETNFYMGAPDRYLKIVLDGTTYLIPAYTPA